MGKLLSSPFNIQEVCNGSPISLWASGLASCPQATRSTMPQSLLAYRALFFSEKLVIDFLGVTRVDQGHDLYEPHPTLTNGMQNSKISLGYKVRKPFSDMPNVSFLSYTGNGIGAPTGNAPSLHRPPHAIAYLRMPESCTSSISILRLFLGLQVNTPKRSYDSSSLH